jgi:predicted Zn-dependent protease
VKKFMLSMALCFSSTQNIQAELKFQDKQMIMDARYYDMLHKYLDPMIRKMNMNPDDFRFLLLMSQDFNAYATVENTMVVYSKVFFQFPDDPSALIGILGHELGHIQGGHPTRNNEIAGKVQGILVGGIVLSGLAAILSKDPSMGAAIAGVTLGGAVGGSQYITGRSYEMYADAMSLKVAKELGWKFSTKLFDYMLEMEKLYPDKNKTGYYDCHPFAKDRLVAASNFVATNPEMKNAKYPDDFLPIYELFIGMLDGKTLNSSEILSKYPSTVAKTKGMYARSIALARNEDYEKSIDLMKKLISMYPKDSCLLVDYKEILNAKGDKKDALVQISKAYEMNQKNPIIIIDYCDYLSDHGNGKSDVKKAISIMENSSKLMMEKDMSNFGASAAVFNMLAIVYHKKLAEMYDRLSDKGSSAFHNAESSFYSCDFIKSMADLDSALKHIDKNHKKYMRAKDLKKFVQDKMSKKAAEGAELKQ